MERQQEQEEQRLSDEWLLQFFENSGKYQSAPGIASAANEDEDEEEEELARQIATQEHIYSYSDGSVYIGHMCAHEDGAEKRRHGRGTLRTPAFVYGEMKNYTSDEAVENAHLAKWHEYSGTWENDKLHGRGVNVQKSGDGGEILIFDGIWEHGKPVKSVHFNDDGDDGANDGHDETVFGWCK